MNKLCVLFAVVIFINNGLGQDIFNGQRQLPAQGTGGAATTQSPNVADCIRNCPVTPEYNPVCGTNSVTYSNPGRLSCAQACGINVNLLRMSPCPPPAQ